jgi:hypothetical protein
VFDKAQEKLWFILGKWKQGRRAMKEARMLILRGLSDFFMKKGMTEDDLFLMCRDFPLVLSVSSEISASEKEWCFILHEELRNYEYVLGIGVVPQRSHPIDQFFVIPAESFGVGGICTFNETDECYARYTISTEKLEENILVLTKALQSLG